MPIAESQTEAKKPQAAGAIVTKFESDAQASTDLKAALDIATGASKLDAVLAPTVNSDSGDSDGNGIFSVGSRWVDTLANETYMCVDSTVAAAIWVNQSLEANEVKAVYEANADTNEFNDAEKVSLATMADQEVITQANYDALSPPTADRIYFIVG